MLDSTHRRMYLRFARVDEAWRCQLLEADLRTCVRMLTFKSDEKLWELAKRGNAFRDPDCKHAFEHAMLHGRGGIDLRLSPEQYAKLMRLRPLPTSTNK